MGSASSYFGSGGGGSPVLGVVQITTGGNQAITGIGFQPSYVQAHVVSDGDNWISQSDGYSDGSTNACNNLSIQGASGAVEFSGDYPTLAYVTTNPSTSSQCRGTITIQSDGFTIVKSASQHVAELFYVCFP